MNLVQGHMAIRTARPSDANQLCKWWNDGAIMAHAGFPNGLGEKPENVRASLTVNAHGRHIIEYDGVPIGEMSYRNKCETVAEIGIKICDFARREKGLGTSLLAMFIDALFLYHGYEKIVLDTNTNNLRAQHVYENKLGFTRVQVRENAWLDQLGQMQSAVDYELAKADWQASGKSPEYLHLRTERPDDHYTVESITRDAHWTGNWGIEPAICDVHLLVNRLRLCPSYVSNLHYVAEMGGKIVGHILYCTSKIVEEAGATHEMLTFGPLSVLPKYKGRGIGKALMRHTFGVARELGYRGVLIFGHPDYYPRVGFRPASEFGITDSGGASYDPFMALPLYDGALDGVSGRYHIDPAYHDLSYEDIIAFDKKFPHKELHVPVSADVLLERLAPPAQKALEEGLRGKSLMIMQTKSERDVSALDGVDDVAIEVIRAVMREHGQIWGK